MSRQICILSTAHSATDVRIFYKQAQALSRAGYRVTYLVPHEYDEEINGIEIRAMPRRSTLARMFSLPEVFRRALSIQADVYHLHDPELVIVGWWLHLAGRRVIYDAHEDFGALLPHRAYMPKRGGKAVASLANWIEKSIARRLDAVITATETIAEGFRGIAPYVVKNYPILEGYPTKSYPGPEQPGLHAIYVGGLTRVRGILEMVEAVTSLDPAHHIRLTIVGAFPHADYKARVLAAAGENVTFTGHMPYPQAMTLLQKADVGLVCLFPTTNYVDALPTKMFEYMRAGLPVIASDVPLWREIVVDGGCGLTIDPHDPSSIAAALLELSEDPERRRAMGERGRRLVCEKYNWQTQEPILLEAYAKVVGSAST